MMLNHALLSAYAYKMGLNPATNYALNKKYTLNIKLCLATCVYGIEEPIDMNPLSSGVCDDTSGWGTI